nr:hypothetical protein [Xanthomonadaceae bacterium]
MLLLRTLLVMVAVYVAQEALVRWLVARGTPAQLRSAQHLVLLQNGLHRNLVELEGLDVDRARMSGPDGKAFLAVFPLLGSGLGERVEADFGPALRGEVTRKLVVSAMGDPNERMRHYVDLYGSLAALYQPFDQARAQIQAKAGGEWQQYRKKLRRRGLNPDAPPRRYHASIRSQVRGNGVPVPHDWHPADRAGFIAAASRWPLEDARTRLRQAVGEHIPGLRGVALPDHVNSLYTEPEHQAPLLRVLGYTCIESFDAGRAGRDAAAFKREVYDREAECQTARQLALEGDVQAGRDARRALLVPFIALVFSLYGALAHIAKFGLYTLALFRGYPLFRTPGLFAGITLATPVLGILLCAWLMASPVTGNALYRKLEQRLPAWLSLPVRGTIHGQKLGYPLFEGIRVHALRGFGFGYHGGEAAEETAGQAR